MYLYVTSKFLLFVIQLEKKTRRFEFLKKITLKYTLNYIYSKTEITSLKKIKLLFSVHINY